MTTSANKSGVTNLLAITAVIVVVAGAVWLRAQRAATPEGVSDTPNEEVVAESDAPETTDTEVPSLPHNSEVATAATATQPVVAKAAKLPRLVDLGADKCVACKKLAPILDALREEYKGRLRVEFIDVWKNPKAQEPYKIRLIPTQILFDAAGEEVWRHEGFISKEELQSLFAEKVGVKSQANS